MTSFSLVRAEKEALAAKGRERLALCHAGTLDPFAHGLLLLLAGEATRLMDLFHEAPKEYVAEVRWGAETDNGDPLGQIVERADASALTPERIARATVPLLGWTEQIPPSTSAKKIGGEPAYRKVHRGEPVELPPSRVYLHSAEWIAHELPRTSTVRLVCRGGYYVRAFARDLGRALGTRAHLGTLHRTAIGPWRDVAEGTRTGVHGPAILPWLPRRETTVAELRAARAGAFLHAETLAASAWPFPESFPDPDAHVLAVRDDLLWGVLAREAGGLRLRLDLRLGL